jgi:DNA-binding winged helix-turn-helix (wHTH) protein
MLSFPPFRLDTMNEQLWRNTELIALRPKTFAVLRHLATHPGRLITQDELLGAVWGGSAVSEGLLRGYICELRRMLDDDAASPRYIETVSRRGYRFVATIAGAVPPACGPPVAERGLVLDALYRAAAECAGGQPLFVVILLDELVGRDANARAGGEAAR